MLHQKYFYIDEVVYHNVEKHIFYYHMFFTHEE